jgi:hypothetical protein
VTEERVEEEVREFYSFKTLIDSDHEEPKYAVEDLLIEGHHGILAGPYAIGKTYLGLQLSVSLATGKDFMGRKVRRPYRVAFIDLENGAAEIKSRSARLLERLALSPEEQDLLNENWHYNDATEPEDSLYALTLEGKGFKRLEDYLAKYRPEVVIVDCYGKAVPWEEKNEERTKDLLTRIARLQKNTTLRCGLFLQFHHPTKPSSDSVWPSLLDNPREWLGRVRGTGRLLDFSPIRLGFDVVSAANRESAYVVNGFLRGQISPLILERNEAGFFDLHSDKDFLVRSLFGKATKQFELFEAIRARLEEQPSITWSQIARIPPSSGTKYHTNTISDTLRTACTNRLFRLNEDGSYSLVET